MQHDAIRLTLSAALLTAAVLAPGGAAQAQDDALTLSSGSIEAVTAVQAEGAVITVSPATAHAAGVVQPTGDSGTLAQPIFILADPMNVPVTSGMPLAGFVRPLILPNAEPGSIKAAARSGTSGLPVAFGTLSNDVLSLPTHDSGAGAVQIVGVDDAMNLTLGVRLAAPTIAAGSVTLLPWARATYQYDVSAQAPTLPNALTGNLNLGGGLNLFSAGSFTASVSGDWERRDGVAGVSTLGRLRVGF